VLDAFKLQFQSQAQGVQNAWKTPVLNADKLEWINLKQNNKDMEFSNWVSYLVKVTCAVYQIAPEEINFDSKSQGSSSVFETGPEAALKYSKDKGLRSLLMFVADVLTEEVIEPYNSDFMFIFAGIDEQSDKDIIDIRTKEVASYKTVDEAREEAGKKPMGEEAGGNLILNPQYIQWLNTKMMSESMGQGEQGTESGQAIEPEDNKLTPYDQQGDENE
jgi:hypothetical protein